MSKSTYPNSELLHSLEYHAEGVPLLVSPLLLRSRNMGQVDLARIRKENVGWVLEIAEVKSSDTGEEMLLRGQRRRLFFAQNFLAALFGTQTRFVTLKNSTQDVVGNDRRP